MRYNCNSCKFHWEGWMDTFEQVLTHEKTHLKNKKIISMEMTS
ncbi:hypothetical protein BG20_I2134 [Candidatus Nitrosarchaeum limnium BG20]|uniref:Uncharacterized protein n=1 Tax=Candidatus Nitrosarchaeum limnium BG20 TaxID=859192 RepID=S2E5F1_9ARCH|nr:hypothetical protein BG20_I2134 [Candidatus Nitrosarchaeum limnium BG20]